jgi:hypothetical protein
MILHLENTEESQEETTSACKAHLEAMACHLVDGDHHLLGLTVHQVDPPLTVVAFTEDHLDHQEEDSMAVEEEGADHHHHLACTEEDRL